MKFMTGAIFVWIVRLSKMTFRYVTIAKSARSTIPAMMMKMKISFNISNGVAVGNVSSNLMVVSVLGCHVLGGDLESEKAQCFAAYPQFEYIRFRN